jgi:hypothetical protein
VKADVRRKLEMAVRALEFSQDHPSTDASYVSVVARLQDRVKRLNADIVEEIDGVASERGARAHREAVRRMTLLEQLRHLVRVARLGVREQPELAPLIVLPVATAANKVFISVAKRMLANALPLKDLLAPYGLGETLLDDIAAAIAEFEQATRTAHGGRDEHVGASAELKALARECVAIVGVLGGFNRFRFRGEPDLLAAWKSVSKVAGPFRRRRGAAPAENVVETPPPGDADGGK